MHNSQQQYYQFPDNDASDGDVDGHDDNGGHDDDSDVDHGDDDDDGGVHHLVPPHLLGWHSMLLPGLGYSALNSWPAPYLCCCY